MLIIILLIIIGLITSIAMIIKRKYIGIILCLYWLLEILAKIEIMNDLYRVVIISLSMVVLCLATVWIASIERRQM